jgi:fatty acid desaturase
VGKEREPLEQVRKSLQIPWYRSPIERTSLKELTRRSNLRGTVQTGGHILLAAVTAAAAWYCFDRGLWGAFAACLFAHGTVFSFLPGLATHELSHGTVFRTRWLNELFLRFLSLITWSNFHDLRMSHTYHHLYTLHPRGDGEVVLPITPTLHPLLLLQIFTLNVFGGRTEPYSWPMRRGIGSTVRIAFTGRFGDEWMEAVYADQPGTRGKSVRWARLTLAFHVVLTAVSIALGLWMLPLVVTFAPFLANWLRYFVAFAMHTGLKDNVPDFRLCVRTISLDPFSSFVYWRMNRHIEHHMYAAVPCYNLKRLSREIAEDMPKPRTLVGAWREMRRTWRRQQSEPGYQFETPLPPPRGERGPGDALEGSLGDLRPKGLD